MSPGIVLLEERPTLQFNILSFTFETGTWSGYDNDIEFRKSTERETDSLRSRSHESHVNILKCNALVWIQWITPLIRLFVRNGYTDNINETTMHYTVSVRYVNLEEKNHYIFTNRKIFQNQY